MARQIYGFSVTTPAGTLQTAPQMADLVLPTVTVESVRVRIPPGPAGQLGFFLAMGGQQIIPYQAGEWIVANDEIIEEKLDQFLDSGDWQLVSYNTGGYPHTLQVTFGLAAPKVAAAATVQPLVLV